MSTADRHTLGRKLEYLRQQLDRLEAYRKLSDPEILGNEDRRLAVERLLELSVQSVTDCSRLLVSQQDWRGLRDERDAFAVLAERRVIPSSLADRLVCAKAFRNVLVHDYVEIDSALVVRHLREDLGDLWAFAKCLAEFLSGNA